MDAQAERFYLVPVTERPEAGVYRVVSPTGEERHFDEAGLSRFAVGREEAQAHVARQAKQTVELFAGQLGAFFGVGREELGSRARSLGLEAADPEAARATFHDLVGQLHALSEGVATGDAGAVEEMRRRFAEQGIDLGDALDDIPAHLDALRRLEQEDAARAAVSGLRAIADAIEGDPAALGARIDEAVERLEREVGPFVGIDREREERERAQDYRRSAKSAISEALRARGITPIASAQPDDEPQP